MSSKTHNILQQTCVFLSSNRESGDKENSKTSDEEIRHVCYNVRREIHDMFLSNYLTYFRSAQSTESLRRYLCLNCLTTGINMISINCVYSLRQHRRN